MAEMSDIQAHEIRTLPPVQGDASAAGQKERAAGGVADDDMDNQDEQEYPQGAKVYLVTLAVGICVFLVAMVCGSSSASLPMS